MEEFGGKWQIRTANGEATVVQSARQISPAVWRNAMSAHCMDHRYYEVLEETVCSEFDYRYLILTNNQTGAVAVQPFFLVDQDITAGLPARLRAFTAAARKRFPRFLTLKIIMIGCAAGEGRLDCAEPWAIESLQEAIGCCARKLKASLILFKDFPAEYRERFAAPGTKGYKRVPSMPAARLKLDFASFDEYMEQKLSRIYRKSLRRKFRAASRLGGLAVEVLHDVSSHVDEIYPLYLQTYERSEYRFEKLTKEYFCLLGQRLPDRVRVFLWRHQGRVVAFALCMIDEDTLYDLNVGLDYPLALELHLYFVTWRDIVSWAINAGLRNYHSGPLNYDPKLHLRLDLEPLDLYVKHTSALINPIFGLAVRFLQPVRHDPTLRKFANADEL
jgi:hypothetical protein